MPWLPAVFQSRDFYGLSVDQDAYNFAIGDGQLADLQGRYVYLLFGFLRCNDVCHRQVANMLALNQQLQAIPTASADQVSFVFVSLDPERDAVDQLQAYFDQQGPDFHSVKPANSAAAHALASEYNEYFVKSGGGNDYQIDHSGFMYVIDPNGRLRLIYTSSHLNVVEMLSDLSKLSTS
nr:SCO family protein [Neiella litorisoli]